MSPTGYRISKIAYTTVYSFTFLSSSSTVYKQKFALILQSTDFKIKPITVYRISINTPLSSTDSDNPRGGT